MGAGDLNGDGTGDGKADLVSWDSAGNVWRNIGDGKGSFGARTKIASGWQGYKGLFQEPARVTSAARLIQRIPRSVHAHVGPDAGSVSPAAEGAMSSAPTEGHPELPPNKWRR